MIGELINSWLCRVSGIEMCLFLQSKNICVNLWELVDLGCDSDGGCDDDCVGGGSGGGDDDNDGNCFTH